MDQDAVSIFSQSMRFCPTDVELIGYLQMRIAGSLPDSCGLIVDANVCTREPWNLPRGFPCWKKGEGYYFTPRRPRSCSGRGLNVARSFKEGVWRNLGTSRCVCNGEGNQIGSKTTLAFVLFDKDHSGGGKEVKTDWHMHEYILRSSTTQQFQDLAICRVYDKKSNQDDSTGESSSWSLRRTSRIVHEEAAGSSDTKQLEVEAFNQADGESLLWPVAISTTCASQVAPEAAVVVDVKQEEALWDIPTDELLLDQEAEEYDQYHGDRRRRPSPAAGKRRRIPKGWKTDHDDDGGDAMASDTGAEGHDTTISSRDDDTTDVTSTINLLTSLVSTVIDPWCLDDSDIDPYF